MPVLSTYATRTLVKVAGVDASGNVGLSPSAGFATYSVLDYGADPTGVADSAPAFRSARGSNRVILVPPGTYLFKTVDTAPFSPHNAGANIDSFSNFQIIGYGATITMDAPVDTYSVFVVTRCTNFQIFGLTLSNSGMGLFSDVNFHISDLTFGADVDLQCFFGDYLINGTVDHITIEHGQAIDMAYITHMRFDDIRADGGDDTASGLCIGISGDTASLGLNDTGVTINQSDDVSFTNWNVTGYNAGCLLQEGKNYRFSGNHWHGLNHPSISPVCISIAYSTDVATPSTGFPVQGVIVDGDMFTNIGATTAGFGILVNASNIVNADLISDITISNSFFDTINASAISLQSGSETHVENLVVGAGNSFSNTTTWINSVFLSVCRLLWSWGFGYVAGSGGSQTQSTSKSTAVTLNATNGNITMHNATLNAGTIVSFTLNNTFIRAEDIIICQHTSGGTPGAYSITVAGAFQSAVFYVRNNTAGNLGEAIVLKFSQIKGGI